MNHPTKILCFLTATLLGAAFIPGFVNASPLEKMIDFLNSPQAKTKSLYLQPFMDEPLTAEQAEQAKQALLQSFKRNAITKWPKRHQEITQREISLNEITIPFTVKTFSSKPPDGYSLYISLHDKGGSTTEEKDRVWKKQQERYSPPEGKYVVPRASTDTRDMWYKPHMYSFYDRLIEGMILFEEVNPNRVYLMGYGTGGDGVYKVAPIMADRFAAASMSAGSPNNSSPLNLRNIFFQIQVGSLDNEFGSHMGAKKYIQQLNALKEKDPGGYGYYSKIHEGRGHNIPDLDMIKWLSGISRIALPDKVVWRQGTVLRKRFYWLGVASGDAEPGDIINASYDRNARSITINTAIDTPLTVYLNDSMMNLDEPVQIILNKTAYRPQKVKRTLNNLIETYLERFDPEQMFSARIKFSTAGG